MTLWFVATPSCGSRKPVATVYRQVGACVITLLDAHSDDATHRLLALSGSGQRPAIGPAAAQGNSSPALGACASDDNTGSTQSRAVSDVARAGRSRDRGIRGGYCRSAVRHTDSATDFGGRSALLRSPR